MRMVVVAVANRSRLLTIKEVQSDKPSPLHNPGRGAVWLARLNGVQEVAGSNPVAPTLQGQSGQRVPAGLFLRFGPALRLRAELRAEFRKRPPPAVNGRRPTRTFRSGLVVRFRID